MKQFIGILLAILFFLQLTLINLTDTAQALPLSPSQAIERLFNSNSLQYEWFAPSFLQQISLPQIERIVKNIQQTLGSYQQVQAVGENYQVFFEEGRVPTRIALNEQGQITLLFFAPPEAKAISITEVVEKLEALPGEVSFLVMKGNSTLAELNADKPLAVGSAFKLAVIETLRQQIYTDKRNWSDVVKLQPSWKSLPSGILQTWPDDTPLTLQTLATLMISLSDNTATDALIDILGRETIEPLTERNRPFLTTRELFTLKNPQNKALLQRYREGDIEQKRQILAETQSAPLPNVTLFEGNPIATDVEWFFTSRELCKLMEAVADLPIMSVNPGVANPDNWQSVAFKGGSEPGVLNLTTWLTATDGTNYCLVVTQNDKNPINEVSLITLYESAIAGLGKGSIIDN